MKLNDSEIIDMLGGGEDGKRRLAKLEKWKWGGRFSREAHTGRCETCGRLFVNFEAWYALFGEYPKLNGDPSKLVGLLQGQLERGHWFCLECVPLVPNPPHSTPKWR